MRSVVCALALLTLPTSAFAGDFDILRGTVTTYRWAGFYAGGDFGYSAANVNFGQAAGPDIANILRNNAIEQDEQISQWPLLGGNSNPQSMNFGGFAGYNTEWENVVLGLELDYSRISLTASSSGARSSKPMRACGAPRRRAALADKVKHAALLMLNGTSADEAAAAARFKASGARGRSGRTTAAQRLASSLRRAGLPVMATRGAWAQAPWWLLRPNW